MGTSIATGVGFGSSGKEAANEAVTKANTKFDRNTVDFVVVFSSSKFNYQEVVETIQEETDGAELIGSSTAGEFTEEGASSDSVTIMLISSDHMKFYVGLGQGLSEDLQKAVDQASDELPTSVDGFDHEFGINLHDGLLGRGEEIAMLAYQNHPMPYAGASSADDLSLEETCVFANDRVSSDALALGKIVSKKPFAQAVGHGHFQHSEGMKVTKAEESIVYELDGKPAYEVWKDAIREKVDEAYGISINDVSPEDDLFEILLTRFEFGIRTSEGEYKVRWPGLTPNTEGPMHFATKIPEGMTLYVMDSEKDDQIEAARRVCRDALSDGEEVEAELAGGLAFDCVCQSAILGEEFGKAVDAMDDELNIPFAGFETYGEVAMNPQDMRAYHNTTTSMVILPG